MQIKKKNHIDYLNIILERKVVWAQPATWEKLQEAKEGFTIIFRLNDIICEQTCILMECIIEEHCESLKKHDGRFRQQRHAILSILKRTVVPAHMDHPLCSVPNWILLP